ncbi:AmmeMemoRadiSam system protein B [Candidatus Microgenomates bacterium]|nr:AmmeMemoRadiSam system protein B [Candidatus Microgenomates bacterium]
MKAKHLSRFLKHPVGLKRWKSKIIFSLIIFLFIISINVMPNLFRHLNKTLKQVQGDSVLLVQHESTSHIACPFTKGVYEEGISQKEKISVRGLIVPHHLLARDLIINALKMISPGIKTIILIGPNHQNYGKADLQVSAGKWQTQFSLLEPESSLIEKINKQQLASIEEDNFDTEHSVCGLVSFLKIYFPKAKIIPLIVKSGTTEEEVNNLADFLSKNCKDCLMVASVDFSHEESHVKSGENDLISTRILEKLDLQNLDNVTVDSPPTLSILLNYLKNIGIKEGELIESSDSFLISGQSPESVTSYITMVFE